MLAKVPALLIAFRFALAPALYLDTRDGQVGVWFLALVALGFLSDLFDGVIARRTGGVTARLREWDGRTDVWFVAWLAAGAWNTRPDLVVDHGTPLLLVVAVQALAWVVDLAKYRRFSNYHTYTAKAWGWSIAVLALVWFGGGDVALPLWAAVALGTACCLEEIAITLVLPEWTHDVPSVVHAVRRERRPLTPERQAVPTPRPEP